MYRFKRLLVGISLGSKDGTAIRYAGMISRLARSEKIIFLHVTHTHGIPPELLREYPDLVTPPDGTLSAQMESLVTQYYDGSPDTRLEYRVLEGSPLIETLRTAKDEDIDVIVMRKRMGGATPGTLFEKLARKAPCSVLFVPEGTGSWFTNILVPVDFSENSRDAVDTAVAIALASNTAKITVLHVYDVPLGYYKTGKSYEEFSEIMKGHAEEKYREFIAHIDLKGVSAVPIFRLQKKEFRGIEDEVIDEHEIQLLIIGARGRRAAAGVLLGSVTEHLIKETTIPLLAVKKKGTGLGILDAILKL